MQNEEFYLIEGVPSVTHQGARRYKETKRFGLVTVAHQCGQEEEPLEKVTPGG